MMASSTTSTGTIRTYASRSRSTSTATLCSGEATVNNNPTVQDVWNTVPAWRFPFISSALAPMPTAAPFIDQVYAQRVAGLSGYRRLLAVGVQYAASPRDLAGRGEPDQRHCTVLAGRGRANFWQI